MSQNKAKTKTTNTQKDIILETALDMFSKKGYASTSMQDIASEANISRGPLYYYFDDKANLFEAVFVTSNETMEQIVVDIFSKPCNIFDKFKMELKAFMNHDIQAGERIRANVRENPEENPNCYQLLLNSRKLVKYIKIHGINEAIEKNELKEDTNGEILVELLFIFHRGLLSEMVYWEEEGDNERIETLINEFVHTLKKSYGK